MSDNQTCFRGDFIDFIKQYPPKFFEGEEFGGWLLTNQHPTCFPYLHFL